MGLLSGGIARIFHSALSGLYLDGTLHAGTGHPIYADGGTIVGYVGGGDQPVKVQTDATGEAVRRDVGFAEGDVTLLVLTTYGSGVADPDTPHSDDAPLSDGAEYAQPAYGQVLKITTDHEITDGYGDRYRIERAALDAARSHYVCRGRLV